MNEQVRNNSSEDRSTAQIARLIILMVFALLLVIFAIQNSHEVIINLWFWVFRTSLALALVITLVMGFLLSLIYFFPLIRNRRKATRKQERQEKQENQKRQEEQKRQDSAAGTDRNTQSGSSREQDPFKRPPYKG